MIRNLIRSIAIVLLVAGLFIPSSSQADGACFGKFPNPITDFCWSCMFPIKLFGSTTLVSYDQEDFDSGDSSAFCYCSGTTKVGVRSSFWEMNRIVEITRTPYCLVTLGGTKINPGFNADAYGEISDSQSAGIGKARSSFRQVHWYINPLMFIIQAVLDDSCMETKGFDLAYMSEIDPTHNDEELEGILAPDAFLFGGLVAQGACSADCIAASAGFPMSSLYWCAGCNGPAFPFTGTTLNHIGGVQMSSLLAQRTAAKLHRAGTQWSSYGEAGMCGYYPQIIMDKRQYKYTMVYPVPQTTKIAGKCCQPFGRTTALWGAGREYPVQGEDFAYGIFRKRDCCQGVVGQ